MTENPKIVKRRMNGEIYQEMTELRHILNSVHEGEYDKNNNGVKYNIKYFRNRMGYYHDKLVKEGKYFYTFPCQLKIAKCSYEDMLEFKEKSKLVRFVKTLF